MADPQTYYEWQVARESIASSGRAYRRIAGEMNETSNATRRTIESSHKLLREIQAILDAHATPLIGASAKVAL